MLPETEWADSIESLSHLYIHSSLTLLFHGGW